MRRHNPRTIRDMTILGGWLFADLLLALMVIFIASQPPIPKKIPPTPTPTQEPRLDFNFQRINIPGVDYNGILNNSSPAVHYVEQYINKQAVLNHRSVGLVIVYDGALTDSDIPEAQNIGQAIIDHVLKVMGQQGPLFQRASYYKPIYLFGTDHSTVVLDIYLFKN